MKNYDLKILKKKYGEKFARLCRGLFPTILETEGLLSRIITERFADNKFLHDDIVNNHSQQTFKNFIYRFANVNNQKNDVATQNPYELMKKAGYTLYKCEKFEDFAKFEKYFTPQEMICTFIDEERLNEHHVFFAVKDNVDEIKRENFKNPLRQDEYGTSVISLQFSKTTPNTLFITNRYNHSVNNPDATFSNDLENIIAGLTDSFEKEFGFDFELPLNPKMDLPKYITDKNGKHHKYTTFLFGNYYCTDNVIINNNGEKIEFNKDKYLLFDYFLLDLENKKIDTVTKNYIKDSFADGFSDVSKIEVFKHDLGKTVKLETHNGKDIIVELDNQNRLVKYSNENLTKIGDGFLGNITRLNEINVKNAEEIGDAFLAINTNLEKIYLPNARKIGDRFLYFNNEIDEIDAENLEEAGDHFLRNNDNVTKAIFPKLVIAGKEFFGYNQKITETDFSSLRIAGDGFLHSAMLIKKLYLPSIVSAGKSFLYRNKILNEIYAPNLEQTEKYFLFMNEELTKFSAPKLKVLGESSLEKNTKISEVYLPSLEKAENRAFFHNNSLTKVRLDSLTEVEYGFLMNNNSITELHAPKLQKVGGGFMSYNNVLKVLNAPIKHIDSSAIGNDNGFLKSHPHRDKILQKLFTNNNELAPEGKKM